MTKEALEGDRQRALSLLDVSHETQSKLSILVDELTRWQSIKNLVGPRTLDEVWTRHIVDSLQLASHAPDAARWLDLGSGAGFPGLVLGIHLAERGGIAHLVRACEGRTIAAGELRLAKVAAYAKTVGL